MNRYKILDLIRRTDIVGIHDFYLDLMQNPNRNELALKMQRDNLIAQLIRLHNNDYYKQFLLEISDDEIHSNPEEVLKRLPLADKKLLTENADRILNKSYKYESGFTGGSTGTPFHYYTDKRLISTVTGFTMFSWSYFGGYSFDDDAVVVGGTSIGDHKSLKKNLLHFLQRRFYISGGEITEDNANLLAHKINSARKPIMLYGYPSSICQYIDIFTKSSTGINTSNIKSVLTTSETLTAERRKKLEGFFGKTVVNLYGARDGGISAAETGDGCFIYNGIDCFVENIEIDGINELVITNLHCDAFPFIRYRIGDVANVKLRDNGYPFVLTNLTGRTRDFIALPDGRKIHGSKVNKIFSHYNVSEYQVKQSKDYSCDIFVVPNGNINTSEIHTDFIDLLGKDMNVSIHTVDSINRQKNNKLRNIISEITPPL